MVLSSSKKYEVGDIINVTIQYKVLSEAEPVSFLPGCSYYNVEMLEVTEAKIERI